MREYIQDYFDEILNIVRCIDKQSIINFTNTILDIRKKEGRLFFLGVGGSAGNASHAVNDFRKILNIESYAVTDNVSELTARINDESWEDSYVNSLKVSRLNKNDGIVILSVGGGSDTTSKNLVNCIKYANSLGCSVLSIVSRDGGYAGKHSTSCINIPVVCHDRITAHAEEWQGILWHMMVNYIKDLNNI